MDTNSVPAETSVGAPTQTNASNAGAESGLNSQNPVESSNGNNNKTFNDLGVQASFPSCSQQVDPNSNPPREDCPPPLGSVLVPPSAPAVPQDGGRSAFMSYFGKPIVYRKDYPIRRFSRYWRRQDVQGMCCLVLDIICLCFWLALTLKAIDFTEPNEDGLIPGTFSTQLLRSSLTHSELNTQDSTCRSYEDSEPGPHEDEVEDVENPNFLPFQVPRKAPKRCKSWKNMSPAEWLWTLLLTQMLTIINIITASIFLCSLTARRRKGLQVFLLLPSFLCFFINIFQQVPSLFQYSSLRKNLDTEMRLAFDKSLPPSPIEPVWNETQLHSQCCGILSPSDWEVRARVDGNSIGSFPKSCCNTTASDCDGKSIIRNQTWSESCFNKEFDKLYYYERWGLFFLVLKVIAEIGIFCVLSDLTRFEYPPAEEFENSTCEINDYRVRCRGALRLRGITKDGRVVVETKYLMPWRLQPSRTDLLTGVALYVRTSINENKGSVLIDKRHNAENFMTEDIQIDLSRKNRGMFVFSLF
ncbi:unnamed protein product [Orchesella dallaii]|uniref:Uncharacterized protein n=1 Tax=Orchesella dallaii TaxID=48710 RepID=A0ABP1PSV6_9HEXA